MREEEEEEKEREEDEHETEAAPGTRRERALRPHHSAALPMVNIESGAHDGLEGRQVPRGEYEHETIESSFVLLSKGRRLPTRNMAYAHSSLHGARRLESIGAFIEESSV